MPTQISKLEIPTAVVEFLSAQREARRARKIERLRLYPLVLRKPLDVLVARRGKSLFDVASVDPKPYGFEVFFKRHIKSSDAYPDGRDCEGLFHLLVITD